jgi:hypothetical protein
MNGRQRQLGRRQKHRPLHDKLACPEACIYGAPRGDTARSLCAVYRPNRELRFHTISPSMPLAIVRMRWEWYVVIF